LQSRYLSRRRFFIKGKIAKEQTSEPYGVKIELVEDLKGNFPKDLSTVLLWGAGDASGCVDKLQGYHIHKKDTILVLMKQIDRVDGGYPTGRTAGDFTTIDCATSVLALSDGLVNAGVEYGWMEPDAFLELLTFEASPVNGLPSTFTSEEEAPDRLNVIILSFAYVSSFSLNLPLPVASSSQYNAVFLSFFTPFPSA
jgi:hypothetical protein